ncbi:bifunctional 5,10-methylenetetrahydrofolate dehydrogenase/5,10-methenyltetrahydrofolate cyclohydrolase [Patescibacteria group bacterium]
MISRLINGRTLAERIEEEAAREVKERGLEPGLGVILVGEDPASQLYVRKKREACERVGVMFDLMEIATDAPEEIVLRAVHELNGRDDIHGILVQLPLPEGQDTDRVMRSIDPAKDADGFHPARLKLISDGEPCDPPGLIEGIMLLVAETDFEPKGRHAVIAANSPVFALPLESELRAAGLEVETVNGDFPGLPEAFRRGDLVVTALGRPQLVTGDMLKPGAVVIDVGTTKVEGRTVGDVEFETAREVAAWLTPVPGGVGPITVAMLIRNVVRLAAGDRT